MNTTNASRMRGWIPIILASLVGIALGAAAMLFFRGSVSEERVGEIVHNYIMENPELLPDAMAEYERRQSADAIAPRRAQFETPYGGAWAGARDGDVVLVEFFDYACGYCRASNPTIDRLIAEDPRLKVVWRELPVLGPNSRLAAFASLVAAEQGRFRQFHQALFAAGRPTPEAIVQAQESSGVRPAVMTDAHRQELASNLELANAVRATGTPTFVVGDQLFNGAVPYDQLKEAIQRARERRATGA